MNPILMPGRLIMAMAAAATLAATAPAVAAPIVFDFEASNPLSSPVVSGDVKYFAATTEQARSGSKSLKFVEPGPEFFESFTYDVEPTAMTNGTVSVWFYDERGAAAFSANPVMARWAGSIILEDRNNPADFVAIEVNELPYSGGRYFATEGNVDRGTAGDIFDSGVASTLARSVGWHKVTFTVGPTSSTVDVDGVAAVDVGGPGGDKTLRLRFMCGAAANGSAPVGTPGLPPGYQPNWYLTPAGTEFAPPAAKSWIYFDDIAIEATAPAAASHACGFEVGEYDTFFIPHPVPIPANDNARMRDFVNQWEAQTTGIARTGSNVAYFRNSPAPFRSVAFDLSGVPAGGQASFWFYDARGPEGLQTAFGASFLIESGLNPEEFLSAEVWNFPYPMSSDPTPGGPNYYLCPRPILAPSSGFESRVFGNRTIGWHEVVITMGATESTMTIDGLGSATIKGPGLDKSPKLRLMADSASSGGYSNWRTVDPLMHIYFETLDPYVYYDDITIPTTAASVADWSVY